MGFYSESMPEPKCQIDWSKDGSSNLADLHWSDLHQEETEITVSSFSYDSNKIKKINEVTKVGYVFKLSRQELIEQEKLNDAYEKLIGYEQSIIEEQKEINNALIALQDFHDEETKALLNEYRQLLSRIERLPEA